MDERKHNLCILTENVYQETCNEQFKNIKRNLNYIQLLMLSLDTSIYGHTSWKACSLTCQIVILFHMSRNHYNFGFFRYDATCYFTHSMIVNSKYHIFIFQKIYFEKHSTLYELLCCTETRCHSILNCTIVTVQSARVE